ncbi:Peptidase C39 family protein [Singulisphaera sp. GP187]|uniref:cysteine peptidase family C39 domain-containing protein n=1 Tax=Singulisphaera sp. GP187 TaxID=1882752 RepID=UPI000927403D|nr:cysteine peptidase family C39 domain-containing protein [Singulisphaera sp. GP187]SIO60657.1 Peptidase C39 family protein [Singulisphaera sp. GP187]
MKPLPMPSIPYRKQETRWTCGAASLRMVYASFGLEFSEAELWAILKPNRIDRSGVYASRLAWEAQQRGFAALTVQARLPWELLSTCSRLGVRVVFHQPLSQGSRQRHFSILTHADADGIVLHDPQFGPALRFRKSEWLELWGAAYGNDRAFPNELVAIADSPPAPDPAACSDCGTAIPETWPCPVCRRPVKLRPAAVLGCLSSDCSARLWEQIACPECGHSLSQLNGLGSDDDPNFALEKFTMSNGDPFQTLNAAMSDYQRKVAKMQNVSSDASVRDVLGKLQESMKLATDKLGDSLERFETQSHERSKRIEEQQAKAEKRLEEATKAREQALAELAAKKAAKAARPQARQAPDDPHLGAKLRDKLLEEFGTRVDQPPAGLSNPQGSLLDFEPGV